MKKILFLVPLMASALLVNCGNNNPPEPPEPPEPERIGDTLKFTCNSDTGSLNIYSGSYEEPTSNVTTNVKYVVKDINDQEKTRGELTIDSAKEQHEYSLCNDLKKGDSVYLSGDNPSGFNKIEIATDEEGRPILKSVTDITFYTGDSDNFSVSGNIMSLIKETDFDQLKEVPGLGCFNLLFASDPDDPESTNGDKKYHCSITDASELCIPCTGLLSYGALFAYSKVLEKAPNILPAMDLGFGCYSGMFVGCEKLVVAPELPATTLALGCYRQMFERCSSLKNAPELKATTLADECYSDMFAFCENLETAPSIIKADEFKSRCCLQMFFKCHNLKTAPTTIETNKLAEACCHEMFYECTSLVTAPHLPSIELANDCYKSMFNGCQALKNVSKLPATTLRDGCYNKMFSNCVSLTTAPIIRAETLADSSCYSMFENCEQLTIKASSSGSSSHKFFICPQEEIGATYNMFFGTKGDFSSGDSLNPGQECYYVG